MRLLTDEDVLAASATVVVAAARDALRQAGRGELAAPPRTRSELGSVDYVYTAGALADGTSGFRVYRAGRPAGDQLVAVWDPGGRLIGLVVGDELGARRTGALGAVAAEVLARPEAETVGLVGTGRQAWTQLWALTAVRNLSAVHVYSRDQRRRDDFAARARSELGLVANAVDDAASAVHGVDIVILATTSTTPVIDADDVARGGPCHHGRPEDEQWTRNSGAAGGRGSSRHLRFPQQAAAYPEPFFTGSTPLVSLADVLVGAAAGRRHPDDITLHCSVGLAGSEVLLANRLLTGP